LPVAAQWLSLATVEARHTHTVNLSKRAEVGRLVARDTASNKMAARSHSPRSGGFVFFSICFWLVPRGALLITIRTSARDPNLATLYT
jgi:hypothetical protein